MREGEGGTGGGRLNCHSDVAYLVYVNNPVRIGGDYVWRIGKTFHEGGYKLVKFYLKTSPHYSVLYSVFTSLVTPVMNVSHYKIGILVYSVNRLQIKLYSYT